MALKSFFFSFPHSLCVKVSETINLQIALHKFDKKGTIISFRSISRRQISSERHLFFAKRIVHIQKISEALHIKKNVARLRGWRRYSINTGLFHNFMVRQTIIKLILMWFCIIQNSFQIKMECTFCKQFSANFYHWTVLLFAI